MKIIKRDGSLEEFNINKISDAIAKAFKAINKTCHNCSDIIDNIQVNDGDDVECIQDKVIAGLRAAGYNDVADVYYSYKEKRSEARLIRSKINYIKKYSNSSGNAASNSNTDANANNSIKNVASIETEVFKDNIRLIQRQMMKDKLNIMYPDVAKSYEEDLNHHIIYTHDESSSPIQKAYCGAYSLYPLMLEGVGNLDGITPTPPNDIQSFSGQVTNAVFALSAQTKGAVALGDYIIALNYYVIKEFGPEWYKHLDEKIYTNFVTNSNHKTVKREIRKGMKQFIFGVNQPQGNRGFQCPY